MTAGQLKADEATCRETLTKCDLAVHALQDDNQKKQGVIDTQQEIINQQKIVIDEQSAWYHNPAIVVPLTVVLTFVGVRLAR